MNHTNLPTSTGTIKFLADSKKASQWVAFFYNSVADYSHRPPITCNTCSGYDINICKCALEKFFNPSPPKREITPLIRTMFYEYSRYMMSVCMICPTCGGGSMSTCECALREYADELTDEQIEKYEDYGFLG